ncbi:hypothetical protein QTP88_020182 [Uroleucon formosanum]
MHLIYDMCAYVYANIHFARIMRFLLFVLTAQCYDVHWEINEIIEFKHCNRIFSYDNRVMMENGAKMNNIYGFRRKRRTSVTVYGKYL